MKISIAAVSTFKTIFTTLIIIASLGFPLLSHAQLAVTVMQYNLEGYNTKRDPQPQKAKDMAALVKKYAPDFITTQETTFQGRNFLFDALDHTVYEMAVGPVINGVNSDVAIFYNKKKWATVNNDSYPNKMTPDYKTVPVKEQGKGGDRWLLTATFKPTAANPDNREVIIYTSHWCVAWGDSPHYNCANSASNPTAGGGANPAHKNDADTVVNIINTVHNDKEHKNAVIIFTGDLNLHDDVGELGLKYADDTPAYKVLASHMSEGYREISPSKDTGATHGTQKLDYIFSKPSFSGQFTLKAVKPTDTINKDMVPNVGYSDHKPLIVTYTDDGKAPPTPESCISPVITAQFDVNYGSVINWTNNPADGKVFAILNYQKAIMKDKIQPYENNKYRLIDSGTIPLPAGNYVYYLHTTCTNGETDLKEVVIKK
jgi:hypothetical protein